MDNGRSKYNTKIYRCNKQSYSKGRGKKGQNEGKGAKIKALKYAR